MNTLRLRGDHLKTIEEAAHLIRMGGLVAYPTDTLYGLGAHAFQPHAVAKVFVAKGRQPDRPLPLLLAKSEDLIQVAVDIPLLAWRLAAAFWPGALTIVLNKHQHVPGVVAAAGNTVAVRVPNHSLTLALIAAVGAPIAGTSANRSGGAAPLTADDVMAQLAHRIDAVLDGGRCPGGVESTVLDITAATPRLIRQGAIAHTALEDVIKMAIQA
jgi:L-threonylcarbamoyladenylate synthase